MPQKTQRSRRSVKKDDRKKDVEKSDRNDEKPFDQDDQRKITSPIKNEEMKLQDEGVSSGKRQVSSKNADTSGRAETKSKGDPKRINSPDLDLPNSVLTENFSQEVGESAGEGSSAAKKKKPGRPLKTLSEKKTKPAGKSGRGRGRPKKTIDNKEN